MLVDFVGRLLRARRERPPHCRAAEQRDELAPLHSITSSAKTYTWDGIVIPSTSAVLRLITRLNQRRYAPAIRFSRLVQDEMMSRGP